MTMVDDRETDLARENAGLRRRLAECEAELAEARAQQTATAEVLQVINSSPGDLAPVFEAMLEKATRLCEASLGQLWMYDDKFFEMVASRGVPAPMAEFLRGRHRPSPETAHGRLAAGEEVVNIVDLAATELYLSGDLHRKMTVDVGGVRSLLGVPLRRDEKMLGIFLIYRTEVRPFSDRQIALLQNFATQAVIAMENARLLTETREALEQQSATAEVLGIINSSPGDLAPVFDAMLEKAMRLCEAAFGVLLVRDGDHFRTAALHGLPAALAEVLSHTPRQPGPGTAVGRMLAGEDFIQFEDMATETAYKSGDPRQRAFVELGGTRSYLAVALRKDGELLGSIGVYRQEVRPFTDKQIALLQNFAAQAVIAMENARLLGELRARTDEIAAMNRELAARVAAQLGELERMGRLKRFLAPQLAEMIVARGEEHILESHRRDIVVVFCDLRGFTTFAEIAEPEEVLDLLREYHAALGPIVTRCEGTLNHFTGDGLMVLFNDPLPCPNAPERAVAMAIEMRAAVAPMQARWRRHGRRIGFGVGVAQGYATVGQIGFAERVDYTAIGTVCNLAARLCAEAQDGQILVSGRIAAAVEDVVRLEEIGDVALKGLTQAVAVYNVAGT
jgi:class 3 adenylate cyclase/putative methionine-R-sulfoxide reductase with GAF domain